VGLRIAAAAVLVALAATAVSARADNPVLTGTVGTGDDFVLTLTGADGQVVKHLDPGTYTIVVHDQSTFHNFHFFGPGGAFTTTVNGTGDQTFTLNLTDGTYTYQCDPHQSQMRGTFTVGSAGATPAVAQLNGSIAGTQSSLRGTAGLVAGKAQIRIADRSKTDGFLLKGPGVSKKTGVGFTGKVTWTVTLRSGTYVYGSAKNASRRHIFSVSSA
jgi:plastocyanin